MLEQVTIYRRLRIGQTNLKLTIYRNLNENTDLDSVKKLDYCTILALPVSFDTSTRDLMTLVGPKNPTSGLKLPFDPFTTEARFYVLNAIAFST